MPRDPAPLRLGYGRVSTDEQADALDSQVARLEAAGCDLILTDRESGLSNDRPGVLEAMAMVRAGQVTELILTRVDRLSRDAAHGDLLLALCAQHRVTVRALDGGIIETATPQGFLLARLSTSLAEMESRMLSMRVRRAFEVHRQQGRHMRRRKPFGYRSGPDYRLEPDPEQWPQALRVLEELREHGSFSRVAMRLPQWCPWTPAATNLQAWFVNPVIRGHVGHQWDRTSGKGWGQRWGTILYDQHPALISESDWQELADLLRRTRNNYRGPGQPAQFGLTGLLVCASCGHRMRRNTSQGTPWWRCRHRLCEARAGVKEATVLPLVVAACVDAAKELAVMAAAPPEDDPRIAAKRRDLEDLRRLATRNPALDAAVAALEQEIGAMMHQPRVSPDLAVYEAMLSDPAFFTGAPAEEQRALFGGVLAEVRVSRGGECRAVPRS